MRSSRFVPDRRAIASLAHKEAVVGDAMTEAARAIRSSMVESVTRSVMGARSRTRVGDNGKDAEGVYGTVTVGDPGWHLLEFGTATLPATRQIMHAVERTGARFVDTGGE